MLSGLRYSKQPILRAGNRRNQQSMKLKPLVLTAALVATLSGCTVVSPPNEEVAVLTDRPWIFGDGGIRADDVRKGGTRTYTWLTTQKQYIKVSPTAVSVTETWITLSFHYISSTVMNSDTLYHFIMI